MLKESLKRSFLLISVNFWSPSICFDFELEVTIVQKVRVEMFSAKFIFKFQPYVDKVQPEKAHRSSFPRNLKLSLNIFQLKLRQSQK